MASTSPIRAFVLNIGDENVEGIKEIGDLANSNLPFEPDVWYDLNGRKLSGTPAAKGLYIRNGRKVVINN